ncbi:MAG: SURF1 family protein [Ignavibacteriales bacterium]
MSKRFPVGATVATAIAFAILVGLGVWQLKRLAWKQDLLARVHAAQTAPAMPITGVLQAAAKGEDVGYRRVTAICPGLSSAPFVELYAVMDGEMGSRLISVCRLDGAPYGSILVDRGFVPATVSTRPPVVPADSRPTGIRGVLRTPERKTFVQPANDPAHGRFFGRQIAPLAEALHAQNPAPLFLMAETSSNPEWQALKPAPLPVDIPNNHFQYALTWFGLAGALLAVYAAVLWGRLKS